MARKKSARQATATFSRVVEPAHTAPTTYVSPLKKNTPLTSWYEILATGFFSGYLPKAPGTWGSLFAALLFLLIARILPGQGTITIAFFHVSW